MSPVHLGDIRSKGNLMLTRLAPALTAAALFLSFATPAVAVPRIVTPGLVPVSGEFMRCRVVNASAKKTIDIGITIYDFNGNIAAGPIVDSILPNASTNLVTANGSARHCVVEVTKGGKKNARVSLSVTNGGGVVAAVNGQ